jgi:hypothetical protein
MPLMKAGGMATFSLPFLISLFSFFSPSVESSGRSGRHRVPLYEFLSSRLYSPQSWLAGGPGGHRYHGRGGWRRGGHARGGNSLVAEDRQVVGLQSKFIYLVRMVETWGPHEFQHDYWKYCTSMVDELGLRMHAIFKWV